MSIVVLQPHIANQIAAGEVVERPASIVKELIENSLDAGATQITVEIENGGLDLIRIADNGCGMSYEDAASAFLRHATSKISTAEDLTHIQTYGFRGEALPSIASVSSMELRTKRPEDESGTLVRIKNGNLLSHTETASANGTTIDVRELFADVPARLKFLKSSRTEAGYIGDYVSRLILAAPKIAFTYISNGRTVYRSAGDGSLLNALYSVYGIEISQHLFPVSFDDGYLSIGGFIGDAEISRPNRTYQSFILNGRYIRSAALSAALMRAYETKLMSGKFPFAVLDMRISGYEVDVNVHPAKLEVRFADEQRVIRSVTAAAHRALLLSELPQTQTETNLVTSAKNDYVQSVSNGTHTDTVKTEDFSDVQESSTIGTCSDSMHETVSPYHTAQHTVPFAAPLFSAGGYSRSSYTYAHNGTSGWQHEAVVTPTPRGNTQSATTISQQQSFFDVQPAVQAPDSFKTLGCAFDTYWMIESGEDLLFIDQHAAHERLIYESLINADASNNSQTLLLPLEISLSESEKAVSEEFRSVLEEIGARYHIDETDGKFYLTAMPVLHGIAMNENFFRQALEICAETGSVSATQLIKSKLSQCACKHAVKSGDRLTDKEITALIQAFKSEGIPMTCPHGRPVMICLKKRELEKLFKRVL